MSEGPGRACDAAPAGAEAALRAAEAACARRGSRLTALRRAVLELVLGSARPLGAYELLDRLRASHPGAAPPTVYRALDFLQNEGLVHKVERLAAYVGCVHGGEAQHAVQFLVCSRCGRAEEIDDPEPARALARAARGTGFAVSAATIEAVGICGACAGAAG
jgi:Fur family transcriptional regulator, zinc uptake regulator